MVVFREAAQSHAPLILYVSFLLFHGNITNMKYFQWIEFQKRLKEVALK